MNRRLGVRAIPTVIFFVAFFLSPAARAQDDSGESKGINSGGYNIHQTIEFGYRASEISGNQNTYDTFENLGSGLRLFDYSLSMRSLDHNGLLFDNLTFSNFGYGGDPNDVTRLRIEKNKWYDFRLLFRRDKNFWDYNLYANPLNPASLNPPGSLTTGCYVGPPTAAFPQGAPAYCSSPAIAQNNSLHGLDLVRRMQDYDLTLLPQSKIQIRLGYSRNRDQGPGSFTTDGGTISDFNENYSYTTNAYRVGVDFKVLPRTTISYDQFLSYFRQDNVVSDNPALNPQNFGFVLANPSGLGTPNGTPVDLGNIWSTQTPSEAIPCATPIVTGTTNTATPTCNGFLSYSQVGRPRNFMPTERLRFQSNYFTNFEMSGSVGYSTSNNVIPDFLETVNGFTVRTAERGSSTGGPADAKRVSVNADWTGVYAVTDKLRILDIFRYDNWRIPGMWALDETNIFGTGFPGLVGLQQSEAVFNAANCPVASNAVTCPQHAASSAADVTTGLATSFLGQNLKSNTIEAQYDFSRRFSAHAGYLYTNRTIAEFSDTNDTGLVYFPGGATGTAANDYLAARGSCALVGGALPAGCTLNADGSVTFLAPAAASPVRSVTTINENALLLGVVARPMDTLRITGDFEFGYNDQSFTRIDPRQVQSYKIHATYKPRPWVNLDAAVDINENRDNVSTVDNLEHDRSYSFSALFIGNQRLSVDFGYNYWNVYTQSLICFAYSTTSANPAPPPATVTVSAFPPGVPQLPGGTACPIAGSPSPLGALATYNSKDNFAHAAVIWKPVKRVTASVGYGGSFVRGNTTFLNPLTPSGTLDFDYQRPYASLAINVYRGFTYKMSWNYYGFNETGATNPFGLAPVQLQDFNGSNATFSLRYAF
ncbi:MAG TPA: hypothetical protein VN902_14640 [Candidatus Acidoferrales bacterium]|nr:hypothetical protein [Candidatus Acidoferrales bacterium]